MKNIIFKNSKPITLCICLIAFAIIIPIVSPSNIMTVMNSSLTYFIAALGLSLMLGMGGQMTFAPIAFMGFGAFTTARLSLDFGVPTLLSVFIAMVLTAALSFILGLILLRLKGAYFAFATISLVQIANNIYLSFRPFSGGPDGIGGIPHLSLGPFSPTNNRTQWFYLLLIIAVICGLLIENIRRTHLGRALASVRDNEIAARTLGVNVFLTKVVAFTIAGGLAGLSGALIAHHNRFVSASLFTFEISVQFLMMVMLGGVNSTAGTFVGTILITMLPEWLRFMREYLMLIYGLGIILLMIFMPMGLAGTFSSVSARVRKLFVKEAAEDGGHDEHDDE